MRFLKICFCNLSSFLIIDLSIEYIFTTYKVISRIFLILTISMLAIRNIQAQLL